MLCLPAYRHCCSELLYTCTRVWTYLIYRMAFYVSLPPCGVHSAHRFLRAFVTMHVWPWERAERRVRCRWPGLSALRGSGGLPAARTPRGVGPRTARPLLEHTATARERASATHM